MTRLPRAFTLIEVLLSLAIFALTAVVLGGAYESSGIGIQLSSKSATVACQGVTIKGVDFENCAVPGSTNIVAYLAGGQGLSGGALLSQVSIEECTGFLSGASTVSQCTFWNNTSGLYARNNNFAPSGGTTCTWNFSGSANVKAVIDPHPLSYGSIPWVYNNGAQVTTASPLVRYDMNASPSGAVPGAKTAIATASWTTFLQGATVGQGGWVDQIYAGNVGATTIAGIAGGVQGMQITIVGDGFTTISYGTSGGAVKWISGGNQLLAANSVYKIYFDGNLGSWVQL